VNCNFSDESDISDVIEVSLNPGTECYCTPIYTIGCTSNDRISNVSLIGESESLDNDSACSDNAYGDYTDLTPPDLALGETYTLSVSTDYSSPSWEDARACVDYSGNGMFDDNEEIANTNDNVLPDGTQEFDFTVPEDVDTGNYRMRVRLVYSGGSDIDPCSQESYGETEDYEVEVIQLEDCEGTPTAGTAEDDEFNVCPNMPITLAVDGASAPANGLDRIWQSSPAGEDDWTDIENAHANTYVYEEGIDE